MLQLIWKNNRLRLITWGALVVLAVVYFLGLYYTDIYITYSQSLMLLDCLKEGELFEFYEKTIQNPVYGIGACYFIPIYVIFAIWNLPVWIATRLLGIGIDNVLLLLWSKGIVVFFTVLSIWMLYRILVKTNYRHLEYALFLFASSLFLIVPAFAVAQYDIIHIFFTLWGIYLYIVDEKMSWRVLVLFSVAISIKLFSFFPFVILVLLSEKRIRYIIQYLICGMLFSIVTILPWYKGYKIVSKGFNDTMLDNLFEKTLPGGLGDVSIFIFGFCIILFVAYLSESRDIKHFYRCMTWLTAAFFTLFFATVHAHPYWIVMLIPFLIPVLIEKSENIKINMILEIIAEGTIILSQGFYFPWVYFYEQSFSYLIFSNTEVKLGQGAVDITDVINFLGMSSYMPGIYAVFIVCMVFLLIINNPWKPYSVKGVCAEEACVENVSRFVRIGLVALYLLVTYMIAY